MVCQTSRTNDDNSRTNGHATVICVQTANPDKKQAHGPHHARALANHNQAFTPIFFFNNPASSAATIAPDIIAIA